MKKELQRGGACRPTHGSVTQLHLSLARLDLARLLLTLLGAAGAPVRASLRAWSASFHLLLWLRHLLLRAIGYLAAPAQNRWVVRHLGGARRWHLAAGASAAPPPVRHRPLLAVGLRRAPWPAAPQQSHSLNLGASLVWPPPPPSPLRGRPAASCSGAGNPARCPPCPAPSSPLPLTPLHVFAAGLLAASAAGGAARWLRDLRDEGEQQKRRLAARMAAARSYFEWSVHAAKLDALVRSSSPRCVLCCATSCFERHRLGARVAPRGAGPCTAAAGGSSSEPLAVGCCPAQSCGARSPEPVHRPRRRRRGWTRSSAGRARRGSTTAACCGERGVPACTLPGALAARRHVALPPVAAPRGGALRQLQPHMPACPPADTRLAPPARFRRPQREGDAPAARARRRRRRGGPDVCAARRPAAQPGQHHQQVPVVPRGRCRNRKGGRSRARASRAQRRCTDARTAAPAPPRPRSALHEHFPVIPEPIREYIEEVKLQLEEVANSPGGHRCTGDLLGWRPCCGVPEGGASRGCRLGWSGRPTRQVGTGGLLISKGCRGWRANIEEVQGPAGGGRSTLQGGS